MSLDEFTSQFLIIWDHPVRLYASREEGGMGMRAARMGNKWLLPHVKGITMLVAAAPLPEICGKLGQLNVCVLPAQTWIAYVVWAVYS